MCVCVCVCYFLSCDFFFFKWIMVRKFEIQLSRFTIHSYECSVKSKVMRPNGSKKYQDPTCLTSSPVHSPHIPATAKCWVCSDHQLCRNHSSLFARLHQTIAMQFWACRSWNVPRLAILRKNSGSFTRGGGSRFCVFLFKDFSLISCPVIRLRQ